MLLTVTELLVFIPPVLLIEGFFAGSEIALLSADKLLLKASAKKGSTRSDLALKLVNHPDRILSVTLLMTSLCMIGTSSLITLYLISNSAKHPELYAVLITSPLIVIVGELIPKTLFQRYADRIAPWVAIPLNWVYWAFYPITRLLSSYTSQLSKLLGPIEEAMVGKRQTTRETLVSMLSYGKRESELKSSEKRMIKRIFDFKDTEAKHAMIPLVRVEALEDTATVREAMERFKEHRHSRMPVYSERIDNIIGSIELSDLMGVSDLDQSCRTFMAAPHYVAETQPLKDLILEMRREDNEMVVVVDEYGGAVGILTFEDIVEEIVGEIQDEYDTEAVPYRELSPSSWLVQARMEIEQINERLKLDLPEGDYETLSGFLLQQFGRIPENGDELYFDTHRGTLKFTVRIATERQIQSVLIERPEAL